MLFVKHVKLPPLSAADKANYPRRAGAPFLCRAQASSSVSRSTIAVWSLHAESRRQRGRQRRGCRPRQLEIDV